MVQITINKKATTKENNEAKTAENNGAAYSHQGRSNKIGGSTLLLKMVPNKNN